MLSLSPTPARHPDVPPSFVTEHTSRLIDDLSTVTLPSTTQEYIHVSKYGKYRYDLQRRETWFETCKRTLDFYYWRAQKQGADVQDAEYRGWAEDLVILNSMPSMRGMMTSGIAASLDNVAIFNCAFLAIDDTQAFSEALYILACGSGLGFSVEDDVVAKLPQIPRTDQWDPGHTIVFEDSRIGWAKGFQEFVDALYAGFECTWDVSQVRPAGAPLKTFGGRASGPEPLVHLLEFVRNIFTEAAGRRLRAFEVHSILCMIAKAIISGGVRRSAEISLSSLTNLEMRAAKSGNWYDTHDHFQLANNSAVYYGRPEESVFRDEWTALVASGSGERGIFNRKAAELTMLQTGRRQYWVGIGVNPCAEILLRSQQFCNLSEVVVRSDDTVAEIKRKITTCVVFGVIQSTFTDFRYLRKTWHDNTEEERLLGVSLTGILDNLITSGRDPDSDLPSVLSELKAHALQVCEEWCARLGIRMSVAITTVKPSGTVSQLVNSASGIHARYSPFFMRAYRENNVSPICQFLKDSGIPWETDVFNDTVTVFYFPVAAPSNSVVRHDLSALEQLELWYTYKTHWAEHSVSCTVYVRSTEWDAVGDWVWKHFDEITGLSFLPFSEHTYVQAPYTEITEEQYHAAAKAMPKIDWSRLSRYEQGDLTEGSRQYACTGGSCEL